jgi:hypothetical protein
MDDFEAYKMYVSLKRHFSDDKYDYFKYNGKSRLTYDSYKKRPDKIFFQKLAKHDNLEKFLISNFVNDSKLWVKDLAYSEQAENKYIEWNKKQQSLTHVLKNDLQKLDDDFNDNFIVNNNQHPKLLKLFLGNKIQIETICLLLKLTEANKQWDDKLEYDPTWNMVKNKITKYTPFIKYDKSKFKQLCLDRFG